MKIRPIRNNADYEEALEQIEALMDAEAGTEEADLLEVLSTLVEDYEARHFPLEAPSPLDAIRFRIEQEGLAPERTVVRGEPMPPTLQAGQQYRLVDSPRTQGGKD